MDNSVANLDAINQLNSFLQGELAAVESYRIALEKLGETTIRGTLLRCLRSHEDRARMLTEAVMARGGEPARSSGTWGALARLVESSAATLGERTAIAALEEGEDHGKNDYDGNLDELELNTRYLVLTSLKPEQQRTHDLVRALKRQLAAA